MKSQRIKNLLEIHIATLLFGFIGIFVQSISSPLITIAVGRSFFATIILIIIILYSKEVIKLKTKKDCAVFVLLGIIQAAQWLTFFQAIRVSSVAVGLLSLYTSPLFVAILEPIFFKEKLKLSRVITSLLILCGIIFVVPEISLENEIAQGILWGSLSAILAALIFLIHRKYIQKYSSTTITFYKIAITTLVLMPFLFFTGIEATGKDILLIAFLGIFFTAVPYVLLIKSMQTLKAQQTSSILSLEVVYGIIFAMIFIHEIPSFRTVLGGIIILCVTLYLTLEAKINSDKN
jgi:drug/metabolite transporter (DMT)-like permease